MDRSGLVFQQIWIGLIIVFEAILMSRQPREKLECLYEDLTSNDFNKTAVLKKIWIVNWSFTPNDSTEKKKIEGVTYSYMH